MKDKADIQREFEVDREDLNKTIRILEGELSLYRQITEKFLSPEQVKTLRENSDYNE